MSTTHVILGLGQSNCDGRKSSTGGVGNDAPFYTASNDGIRIVRWSGAVPGAWTNYKASDPWADPTNAVDGAMHARRAAGSPLSALGTGPGIPFADALINAGLRDNILLVPCPLASTYVLLDWVDSGGYLTEPAYATLAGAMLHRLDVAMGSPNAKITALWYGGESEAADGEGYHSHLTLGTDLGALFDRINALATARSWSWYKNHAHFVVPNLSAGTGSAPLSWPQTTSVRATLAAMAASRTDMLLVETSFAGTWIHRNKTEEITGAQELATPFIATT